MRDLLKPEQIARMFLGLLIERLGEAAIVRCDNLAHVPANDGTVAKFLATAQSDKISDPDLLLSEEEFAVEHLKKMADDMSENLKVHLRACTGCELLVFKLENPGGMEWSERVTSDKLHVRLVRGYDIRNNLKHTRFDVLFGIRAAVPMEVAA